MDTSTITFLTNAFILLWLGVGVLYSMTKGLPLATTTAQEFGNLALALSKPLRDLFNKDTQLAKALKAKGVNPEIADKLAELGADMIEMFFHAPPREVVLPPPANEVPL